jgi:uncharacterized protein (TIGR03435 family)
MKFHRSIISALILLLVATGAARGQTPQGKLSFDVATVKPAAPLDMQRLAADVQAGRMPKIGPEIDASRATYSYMSLDQLIALAYNVRLYQIGGPPWLSDARFDIEATIPEGATKDDAPAMLRVLLEERFKLVAHRTQEEHTVLALVVGKSGPKMKEAATAPQAFDPNSPLAPGERQIDGLDGPMRMKLSPDGMVTMNMGAKGTITQKFDRQNQSLDLKSSAVTMAGFAEMLSNLFMQMGGANSRQVVDMTGLKGNYEVAVEISLADMVTLARSQGMALPAPPPSGRAGANTVPEASDPGGGSSVYESVRQMGLKLEDSKATVDRLVIDHVEKTPTEN